MNILATVVRNIENLEGQLDNIQRIEQMMAKVKQAQQNNWPVPVRLSQSAIQQRQSWYQNMWNTYAFLKKMLTNADTDTRAFLAEILRECAIPELRGLAELAGVIPYVKKENAREKCYYCQVSHIGYPHRKTGLEAKKSKSNGKKVRKQPVIIEGIGIVYEERTTPCERVLYLRGFADEYMKKFVRKARSIEEIKAKAREANRKVGQGKPRPFYVDYTWIRELECYARVLKEGYPNCPFFEPEKPYPEVPQNPEPYFPEPAIDHFPEDVVLTEDGNIKWSPKHGSEDT